MIPAIALFAFLSAQNSSEELRKASTLYRQCQAFIKLDRDPKSVDAEEATSANECLIYIEGFIDGLRAPDGGSHICLDAKATIGTAARLFLVYMDKHPKAFDAEKGEAMFWTLVINYPCVTKP